MKSRSFLALALIVSLAVLPSLQLALAASTSTTSTTSTSTTAGAPSSPYTQKLDIYVAGSSDYWLVTLNPVNETKPGIIAAENVAGVNAYELTSLRTSDASPSSELFWNDAYKVLHIPFYPDQGVFLNVSATSAAAANQAAKDFDGVIGTAFTQISAGGGNYTFFSPGDFTLAGEIMYTASVPTGEKGLADISSAFSLAADPTPTAILTGVRSGSTFDHSFIFGSTQTNAVATNQSLTLVKALNYANDSFLASGSPGTTQVVVHGLDGLMSSADSAAKVSNHVGNYSSSYTYTVTPNTRFRPNITLIQDPPVLTATRLVSTGSALQNGLISVTLLVRNSGETTAITNISADDTWFNSYSSLFTQSAGSPILNVPSLSAGQNASEVYVLKVASTATQDIVVPPLKVTYQYTVGSVTVNATAMTNALEIRTNDNTDPGPALSIIATSSIASSTPLGTPGVWVVTVKNNGIAPALNLAVGNFTQETLVSGGSWTFNMSQPLTSLIARNLTRTFTVTYEAPDGTKGSLTSNPDVVVLSHNGIVIPLVQFSLTATLSPEVLTLGHLNATYTLTNAGNAAADSVSVNENFTSGITCVLVRNGTATCPTPSTFSLTTGSVATSGNVGGILAMNFGTDNYVTNPGFVTTKFHGLTLHTAGQAYVVPAGIVVTRTDNPNPIFEGQNDTVNLNVANKGSLPVYNVSLTTNNDVFDTAVAGSLFGDYATINGSSSQSLSYTVTTITPGNHTTASIALSYAFAGFSASYTVFPGTVLVYKDVIATTTTKPSTPTEGSNFALALSVNNPSKVTVTNVDLQITVPKGITVANSSSSIQLKGRTLELSLASLGPGVTSTHYISLKSGADGSFSLGSGTLTFQYLNATAKGIVNSPAIVVGVDLLLRYELPIGLAVLLTVLIALYVQRKLSVPPK